MKRFGELVAPMTPEAMERDVSSYVDFLAKQKGVKDGADGHRGAIVSLARWPLAGESAAAPPEQDCCCRIVPRRRTFTKILPDESAHGASASESPPLFQVTRWKIARCRKAADPEKFGSSACAVVEESITAKDIYEGALHAWTIPDSPVYNEPQAERAYEKLTALFAAAR